MPRARGEQDGAGMKLVPVTPTRVSDDEDEDVGGLTVRGGDVTPGRRGGALRMAPFCTP